MQRGYWRYNIETEDIHECSKRFSDDVTACMGGAGTGKCLGNNTGLMCSTCVPEDGRPRQSFTDSECQDCLDMGVAAVVVLAAILGFAVVTGILVWIYMYPPEWGLEFSRLMHILSDAAQMVGPVKFKVAVAFYQVISGLEATFGIGPLPDELKTVIGAFEWMELNWTVLAFPVGCLNSYLERLAVSGFGPLTLIVFIALLIAVGTLIESALYPAESEESRVKTIALRCVPLTVLIVFLMLPNTSRSVFASWLCVRYGSGPEGSDQFVYYMLRDPGTMCYTDHYYGITGLAIVLIVIWPIGMSLFLYSITFLNRETLLAGKTNRLSDFSRFLTGGYLPQYYYWESVELFRRLICTGWVVLVPYDQSSLRLVVAIIASLLILVATAYAMPCRRIEDNVLTIVAQTTLLLVYVSCIFITITDSDSLEDREKMDLLGYSESKYFYFIIIACTLIFLLMIAAMLVYGIVDEMQRIAFVKRMEGWAISTISAPGLAFGCLAVGGVFGCIFASIFGLLSGFVAGMLGGLLGGLFGAKYGQPVGELLSSVNPMRVRGKFVHVQIRRQSKSSPPSGPIPVMDAAVSSA